MGASDVTTQEPAAGNGDVVDDAPAARDGAAPNGRRAGASRARNGKLAQSKQQPAADAPGAASTNGKAGNAKPKATSNGGATVADEATAELPAVSGDDLDLDDLDERDPASDEPQEGRGRKRGRTAKRGRASADREPRTRGRQARRAEAARRATPAARRAALVATAEAIVAAQAEADAAGQKAGPRRIGKVFRRLFALVAILMFPASVLALVKTDTSGTPLASADASFMSSQLVSVDQGVRTQLVRLRALQTSHALNHTRNATVLTRSLVVELGDHDGPAATRLRTALNLEAAWLNAVGSTLINPSSPLRGQLVARDAAARRALAALPTPAGHRKGGATQLIAYAKSRVTARHARRRHHR